MITDNTSLSFDDQKLVTTLLKFFWETLAKRLNSSESDDTDLDKLLANIGRRVNERDFDLKARSKRVEVLSNFDLTDKLTTEILSLDIETFSDQDIIKFSSLLKKVFTNLSSRNISIHNFKIVENETDIDPIILEKLSGKLEYLKTDINKFCKLKDTPNINPFYVKKLLKSVLVALSLGLLDRDDLDEIKKILFSDELTSALYKTLPKRTALATIGDLDAQMNMQFQSLKEELHAPLILVYLRELFRKTDTEILLNQANNLQVENSDLILFEENLMSFVGKLSTYTNNDSL